MGTEIILAIISGVAGGGVTLLTFLIRRRDEREKRDDAVLQAIDGINKRLDSMDAKRDVDKADAARRRILAFDDELRRHIPHSEEAWNGAMDDVTWYLDFCEHHDHYKNQRAVSAIDNLKTTYREVKDTNAFI